MKRGIGWWYAYYLFSMILSKMVNEKRSSKIGFHHKESLT